MSRTGEPVQKDSSGQPIRLQRPAATPPATGVQRADARRNRAKILEAARDAFEEHGETSMAAVARRAGVGMATLYRNFPGRRELLEAVYADQVSTVCEAAQLAAAQASTPGAALQTWLLEFAAFISRKHGVASELLTQADEGQRPGGAIVGDGRSAVLAAGRSLLETAQRAGDVRDDVTLEQILDMVVAVAAIHGDADYVGPILRAALDGLLARRSEDA